MRRSVWQSKNLPRREATPWLSTFVSPLYEKKSRTTVQTSNWIHQQAILILQNSVTKIALKLCTHCKLQFCSISWHGKVQSSCLGLEIQSFFPRTTFPIARWRSSHFFVLPPEARFWDLRILLRKIFVHFATTRLWKRFFTNLLNFSKLIKLIKLTGNRTLSYH